MYELFIFRHGQTDWNKEGRLQGHTDVPLNQTGVEQANSLIPVVETLNLDVILSSDLQRAYRTAEIATQGKIKIERFSELREAQLGIAEGKNKEDPEIAEGFEMWLDSDNNWFHFEGGESPVVHRERVFHCVMGFLKGNDVRRVGISTHGGAMVRFVELCHNRPKGRLGFKNGAVIKVLVSQSGWEYCGFITP